MATTVSTPAAIPTFIEEMLDDRQLHVDAIAVIDATLARVSSALGVEDVTDAIAKPMPVRPMSVGRPPMPKSSPKAAPSASAPAPKKRGKASKFGMSANDFVLAFVDSTKTATTQDINKHWKESGRPGTADNSMSLLTKLKKLKRTPLPGGQRGSKFTVG